MNRLIAGKADVWLVLLLMFPLAALSGTAVYLRSHWAEIPKRFPIHWNLQGVPNGWSQRTMMGVYGPLMIGGAVVLLIVALTAVIRWGAQRSASSPAAVAILVIIAWAIGGVFTMAGLLPLHYFPPGQVLGLTGGILAVVAGTIVVAVRRARQLVTTRIEATPDACWHWGQFYYNPQDSALLVEKRIGIGWTFTLPIRWRG